jgi:hypothetical protein
MPRRKISQREAARNARDLRRAREILGTLANRPFAGTTVATIELHERVQGVFQGLAIAGGFIVTGARDGAVVRLTAHRVPEGLT